MTLDLPRYELNNEIKAELIGENEDQKQAQEFLTKAFGVALFLMLMILLSELILLINDLALSS